MQVMRSVLLVTYYFPPREGIGSRRMAGLAKYLPQFGWEPIVLTAALPDGPRPAMDIIETDYQDVLARWKRRLTLRDDANLHAELGISWGPDTKPGWRHKLIGLGTEIGAYPDPQRGWFTHALKAGMEFLERHRETVDALLSSSGPFTAHLIASRLKRGSGIPWIADLRDLWTQNHYYRYGRIRRVLERRLERKTLSDADALVTVSEPLRDTLKQLHPDTPVYAIPNGFDPETWSCETLPLLEKFTITHTGQLYEGRRDPTPLLRVIGSLIESGAIDPDDFELRFFGPYSPWLDRVIQAYDLGRAVKQHGLVPQEEALAGQRESHLLLLLTWNNPNERGVYTGKVFEYLAARRPIIALGRRGDVVDALLLETKAGTLIDHEDAEGLRAVILASYNEHKTTRGATYAGDEPAIMRYSHHEMTRQFAELLNMVQEQKRT